MVEEVDAMDDNHGEDDSQLVIFMKETSKRGSGYAVRAIPQCHSDFGVPRRNRFWILGFCKVRAGGAAAANWAVSAHEEVLKHLSIHIFSPSVWDIVNAEDPVYVARLDKVKDANK